MRPHRLILVPPLSPTPGSKNSGRSLPGRSRPSNVTSARSTTCLASCSPPSAPWSGWRHWSPRVLKIAALLQAVERIDPNGLDLPEAAAANLLARAQQRAAGRPPFGPVPLHAPLRMALTLSEPSPDPTCALYDAVAVLEAAADATCRRRE